MLRCVKRMHELGDFGFCIVGHGLEVGYTYGTKVLTTYIFFMLLIPRPAPSEHVKRSVCTIC